MPSFNTIELLVQKEKTLKLLAIYGHGGHLGHVTEAIFINLCPSFSRRLHIKFEFNMRSCYTKIKMFENNGHIHAFSPRAV